MTQTPQYRLVARVLHWMIAVLILGQLVGGWYMTHLELPTERAFPIFQLHKSFGFIVLILSVSRLVWRLGNPPPALPDTMPRWQQQVAGLTHWAFYGLMIGVPLAGWVLVSASPYQIPTKLFFILPIPHLPVPVSAAVAGVASQVHMYLALATFGLLVLHIGAALKHHLKDRDDVLLRMAPKTSHAGLALLRVVIAGYAAVMVTAFGLGVLFLGGDHDDTAAVATIEAEPAAAAANTSAWGVIPDETSVTLTGQAYGAAQTVTISGITASIVLDPDAPEDGGSIDATLDLTSMTGGDAATTLRGALWFNIGVFPTARYAADEITQTGAGAFLAAGELTIRGVTVPMDLPFTLAIAPDGTATAMGEVAVSRAAFGLGGTDPAIADLATVAVRVTARPAGSVLEE